MAGQHVTAGAADLGSELAVIERWQRELETVFLHLGERLIAVHGRLERARAAMTAITDSILDASGEAAVDDLRTACEGLSGLMALDQSCRAGLEALHTRAEGPRDRIEQIAGSFSRRHLATVARIEVTGVAGSGRGELTTFVEVLGGLVDRGRATTGQAQAQLHHVERGLAEARRLQASVGQERADGSRRAGETMTALAARLTAYRQATRASATAIGAAFADVWRAVDGVVGRIQFQDQTRQRLEQSLGAVKELISVAERGRLLDGGPGLDPIRRQGAISRLGRLAAAQLRQLAADLTAEAAQLRASLIDIGRGLSSAEHDLEGMFGSAGRDESAILAALDRGLVDVLGTVAADADDWAAIRTAILEPTEAASRLAHIVDQLRDLETDMRLAGLNATLRASRLADGGRTMQEIAREIRAHAADIDRQTSGAVQEIGVVAQRARALADDTVESTDRQESSLRQRLERCQTTIHHVEGVARQHHRAASEACEGLVATITAPAGELTVDRRGAELLNAFAQYLEDIAAGSDPAQTCESWPELEHLIAQRYTAHSEQAERTRRSAGSIGRPPTTARNDAPADLSDVLF